MCYLLTVFGTLKAFLKPLTVRFLYRQYRGPFCSNFCQYCFVSFHREWSFILIIGCLV